MASPLPRPVVYRRCMPRISVDIDDRACAEVMQRYGLATRREAVNFALRTLAAAPASLDEARALRGTGWDAISTRCAPAALRSPGRHIGVDYVSSLSPPEAHRMKVAFIGVGKIGRPMARQVLAAGFDLTVHDLSRDAAAPLLDAGAKWARSPREAADGADVVCTCVQGPPEMERAVLGDDGIASSIRPGAVYADHTTNSPALVRRVHDELKARGVDMLDAPVSGGVEGARTRDLTVLAGGDADALERCRPVLDAMAKTVLHVGPIGAGCVCKIAHNCATFVRAMALMECLTLGVKAGVAPDVLIDAFSRGALGTNLDLLVRMPETLFRGNFEPRFTLRTAIKDITLATELAEEVGVPVQMAEACRAEMNEALERGLGDLDSSIALTLQEERAGVEVRLPQAPRAYGLPASGDQLE